MPVKTLGVCHFGKRKEQLFVSRDGERQWDTSTTVTDMEIESSVFDLTIMNILILIKELCA